MRQIRLEEAGSVATLYLPKEWRSKIIQMLNCEYAICTRGDFFGTDSVELLFEDYSDAPIAIRVPHQSIEESCSEIRIYENSLQRGTLPLHHRKADTLPWMKKLSE